MRVIRAIGSLIVVGLVAASCGANADSAEPAPFDAVLIELFGTTDTEAYLASAEWAAAELVKVCMNEAGFEFEIPPEPTTRPVPDSRDLDRARSEGFGIISEFREQLQASDLTTIGANDPNLAYLSTLSSAEISRFFLTLDGVEGEPGRRQLDGGCNGEASEVAYADWLRFFEALPNYTALAEERDTHPDWVAARIEWRACMAEMGFDYGEPDAIRADVISRMRTTVSEIYPQGQLPLVDSGDGLALDPQVAELLDDLAEFERDAAVANVECSTPVAEQFDAVEHEVQQAFVDRHRATVDELLEAAR